MFEQGKREILTSVNMENALRDANEAFAIVRPYQQEDREALADLWVEAWNATLPAIDFSARRFWILDFLERAPGAGPVLCAIAGGRLAGFITVERDASHIEQLAVAVMHQGSGVAGRLCAEAMARSPGWLTLSVNQDNPRAVRFYRRLGFETFSEGVNPGGTLKIWNMRWNRP